MPHQILLVDDDPNIVASVQRLLRREPECETRVAHGGEEALQLLATYRPDLILMDVMMPGLNGHELCRRIRAESSHRFVKIIFVSGGTTTPERLAGYAAGADDFLSKPFDVDELLAKVRVYSRLKRTEELDEMKGRLLVLFAHETRTPLTVILGAADVLLENPAFDGDHRDLLTSIRDSGLRLNQFAQKALLLCKLKSGDSLRLSQEPIASHCAQVVGRFADASALRRVHIDLSADPALELEADWSVVDEVLGYLLDNALRFTPEGGLVRLEVRSEETQIVIRITDEGPGVSPERRSLIFDEFSIRDLAHHQRGQGLSLAIAQKAIELHGGSIELTDSVCGGAVFALTFPRRAKSTPGTGLSEHSASVSPFRG